MVITLPLFQAFPQRKTNLQHHSLLVYRADSHWITYLTFPLSLSQEYWWKADHAPFKACYVISRRKVRSSCSSRRCRRLLSNLVQFCAERERERERGGREEGGWMWPLSGAGHHLLIFSRWLPRPPLPARICRQLWGREFT